MVSEGVYAYQSHCCICIQLGKVTAATTTVMCERRDYQACDEHAGALATHGLVAAIKNVKRNPSKGAV